MIKTRREFLVFNTNQTLVLENPLSVEFYNFYDLPTINQDGDVTINNTLTLIPYWRSLGLSGSAILSPQFFASLYYFKVENNPNELDVTQYQIRFFNNSTGNKLIVIVKYIVK